MQDYVVINDTQKNAIKDLILHVFGSFENYNLYKDSGKSFPEDYKWCKRAIVNGIFGPEKFGVLISLCHAAIIPTTSRSNIENDEKHGSNGGGIYIEGASVIVDTTNHISGSKRASTPWDSAQYKTYKTRITSLQSQRRRANWTYAEILEYSIKYTAEYNRKFGTNFEVYMSAKKGGKKT